MNLDEISKKIKPILELYDVKYAGVFGSYSRGENTENSDIDILVSFNKPISLITFFKLRSDLTKEVGKDVDLISDKAIVSHYRDYILNDLKDIYGKRR